MLVIGRITRAIGHCENHAGSYRTGELDGLLDLLVSRPELLRTCEVGDRSRFAMKSEDKSQVHQLLGLGVERSGRMDFLEVVGVALVGVEVSATEIRHVLLLHSWTATSVNLQPAAGIADSEGTLIPTGRFRSV
jgi:hypothetical protein